MKSVYNTLLALTVVGLLSCSNDGKDDPSQYLTMDIGKSAAILIPAPAKTLSCEQIAKGDTSSGAINGAYFALPTPNIQWTKNEIMDDKVTNNPSEIRIVVLKFTLLSPALGGEYTCIFSDLNLGSLFFKRSAIGQNIAISTWDGLLGRNSGSGTTSTKAMTDNDTFEPCLLKCGGINLRPNTGQFSVTGTWEMLAVQKKYQSPTTSDYEEFPIKVQGSFTVDNVLN